jgi:hypothetical protein
VNPTANLDWLYTLAGWTIAGAGLLLLLWALFHDRSRGRRRCPKCWYDMAGVPGLQCPECGRTWATERRLQRTRRRWRRASAGAIMLIAAIALCTVPSVRQHGWWSLVPNAVIVAGLPRAGEEGRWDQITNSWIENPYSFEMARRIEDDTIRDWELAWALERVQAIRTRPQWDHGEPTRAGVWPPRWLPYIMQAKPTTTELHSLAQSTGMSISGTFQHIYEAQQQDQLLGILPVGSHAIEFQISLNPQFNWASPSSRARERIVTVRLHTEVLPRDVPAFPGVASESLSSAVRKAISVNVSTWNGTHGATNYRNLAVYTDRTTTPSLRGIALGVVAELLLDGSVVRTIEFERVTRANYDDPPIMRGVETVPEFSPSALEASDIPRWSIRIRGNRPASLREFDCSRYWNGEFTVPLSEVLTR